MPKATTQTRNSEEGSVGDKNIFILNNVSSSGSIETSKYQEMKQGGENGAAKDAGITSCDTDGTNDVTSRLTNGTNETQCNAVQKNILRLIDEQNNMRTADMALRLSMSQRTVKRNLKQLTELGLIRRVGTNRSGYWVRIG